MKILVVGSDHEAALEQYYIRYLGKAGIWNTIFPAHGMFYRYYNQSISNKIAYKLGVSSIFQTINKKFLQAVEQHTPDTILIFRGLEIFPETLIRLKRSGIKLVNYNPDNPFIFSGSGSGNKNITNSIPLFDLHLTYNLEVKKEFEKLNLRVAYLPFAFDVSDELVKTCSMEGEICKACFLGNPDQERANFLNELAAGGLEIDIYGDKWNRFKLQKNINVFGPVYGDIFWRVLRKYRVQINLLRKHNLNSHNMRTFEIQGIQGLQLAPETYEHNMFFINGDDIFLFKNSEQALKKARDLLKLDNSHAERIRKNVRDNALKKKHTYKDRTYTLLDEINKL